MENSGYFYFDINKKLCYNFSIIKKEIIMRQKYVTLDKRTKKQQKEFYSSLRGTWGELNPITRKPKNSKAYDRAKEKQNKIFE